MKLVTKRLLIREFVFSDDLDLFEMCSDPYTAYDAGWYPHTNLHITKGVLLNYTSTYETFAIVLQETNKVIGTISLYTANIRKPLNCRELGFCLNKAYRNRGYMTEAIEAMLYYGFKELNLDMIMVCHHEKNHASKAVINKFPFVYEGTLRMYRKLWDDTIVDGVMYSMKKEEYRRYKK